MSSAFKTTVAFEKIDEDERLVTGWASVTSQNGVPVVDLQGDVIDIRDLRKAVEEFMGSARDAGYMHERNDDGVLRRIGKIVDSMIITSDTASALGMTSEREGWVITMRVENDEVWNAVKAGELSMFSIGGMGSRVEIEDD